MRKLAADDIGEFSKRIYSHQVDDSETSLDGIFIWSPFYKPEKHSEEQRWLLGLTEILSDSLMKAPPGGWYGATKTHPFGFGQSYGPDLSSVSTPKLEAALKALEEAGVLRQGRTSSGLTPDYGDTIDAILKMEE